MKSDYIDNAYSGSGRNFPPVIKAMIILNVLVFVLVHIGMRMRIPLHTYLGLVPLNVIKQFMVWQLVTYLFVHAGLWHLLINMLILWMFGAPLENIWGKGKFFTFYFFTGIGAGICSLIAYWGGTTPVVGVSGVIFGLLVAHAVLFPESIILFFFLFPMKIKYAVWIFVGIDLLSALSNPGSGVAYFAHLGGGLLGYIYLKNDWIQQKMSYLDVFRWKELRDRKRAVKKEEQARDLGTEVDRILDKISRNGIHSMTKKEKKILDQRSRKND